VFVCLWTLALNYVTDNFLENLSAKRIEFNCLHSTELFRNKYNRGLVGQSNLSYT